MEYLGWTITDPAKLRNSADSTVYAIDKKGDGLTAETMVSAMRIIRIKIERSTEIEIEMDAED